MPANRPTTAPTRDHGEAAPLIRAAQSLDGAFAKAAGNAPHGPRVALFELLSITGNDLRRHCEVTERPDGTLGELEIAIGRLEQLAAARAEHVQMLSLTDELTRVLERSKTSPHSSGKVRSRVAKLTTTLRVHCVNETDLVQIRFNLDIGGYG